MFELDGVNPSSFAGKNCFFIYFRDIVFTCTVTLLYKGATNFWVFQFLFFGQPAMSCKGHLVLLWTFFFLFLTFFFFSNFKKLILFVAQVVASDTCATFMHIGRQGFCRS